MKTLKLSLGDIELAYHLLSSLFTIDDKLATVRDKQTKKELENLQESLTLVLFRMGLLTEEGNLIYQKVPKRLQELIEDKF